MKVAQPLRTEPGVPEAGVKSMWRGPSHLLPPGLKPESSNQQQHLTLTNSQSTGANTAHRDPRCAEDEAAGEGEKAARHSRG